MRLANMLNWLGRRRRSDDGAPIGGEVSLTSEARKNLLAHARREAPALCLGILAGTQDRIVFVRPVRSVAGFHRARNQFIPDPDDWNHALEEISRRGLTVNGIYRTQPLGNLNFGELSYCLEGSAGIFVIATIEEPIQLLAFAVSKSGVRELSIAPGGLDEAVDDMRNQFAISPCLSLYTFIEAFDRCVRICDWQGAKRLMSEITKGGYDLWPAAVRAVEMKERLLELKHAPSVDREPEAGGVKFLTEMLSDQNRAVRRDSVRALRKIGNIETLADSINHASTQVQMLAASELRKCGSKALRFYRDVLKHPHWFVRWQAIEHLAAFSDTADLQNLLDALEDVDVDVCEAAIRALRRLRPHSIEERLEAMGNKNLRDSNGRPLNDEIRDTILSLRHAGF